jgi:beta-lactamase class D
MGKQIQPINIWINGENKVAEYFSVTCINDNYENSATNYWQMFSKLIDENGVESKGEQLAQGNLTISGQDYINWGDQPAMSINEWIYNWSASQLNLTII